MANNAVHTGLWIDHSRNPVLGATITLESKSGSQLVAAAAIVVQLTGVALWSVLAFIIHQRRSKAGFRDEYDAQVQVLLRNSAAADGAVGEFLDLGRAWAGRRPGVWKNAAGLAVIPAIVWMGFIVAGVFVGQIATNSYSRNDVLIKPGACGFIAPRKTLTSFTGLYNVNINVTANAIQYARSCYSGAGSLSSISCSVYTVPALDYNVLVDQPCPIPDSEACYPSGDVGAPVTMKTKALDTHHDLGINAPKHERMTVQDQTTCAPLTYSFVNDYIFRSSTFNNDTDMGSPQGNSTAEYYLFGDYSGSGYTFFYAPIIRYWGIGVLGYTVNAAHSYAPHKSTTLNQGWSPTTPFNRTQGDLSLFAVSPNSIVFSEPVQDPMFRTFDTIDPNVLGPARYVPTRSVYVVACSSQQNLCNAANGKCTGWNTLSEFAENESWVDKLGLNEQQNATFNRLVSEIYNTNMFSAVNGVADPLLASSNLISSSGSRPVPNGQWRKEVEGWYQTVLSKLQFFQTVFPQVPLSVVDESNVEFTPAEQISKALAKQCKHQRVAAPNLFTSYNLFALVLIAFFGLLVPALAIALKTYHHALPGVGPTSHRFLSYQAEGLMQLHRMALEGSGYRDWEGGIKHVPRTKIAEERIPQVAIEGGEEPMTRYPRSGKVVEKTIDGKIV